MFGIALAYFLFPAFNSETDPSAWLNVYLLLTGLVLVAWPFLRAFQSCLKRKTARP